MNGLKENKNIETSEQKQTSETFEIDPDIIGSFILNINANSLNLTNFN